MSISPAAIRSSFMESGLRGMAKIPGDKSISHRALMIPALAVGVSHVDGLLCGEDVLATARALRVMGIELDVDVHNRSARIHGAGLHGLRPPDDVLDMGNSGTSARLLMGIIAGHPFSATLTGDVSLRQRPMGRIADPIRAMGAQIDARRDPVDDREKFPLTVRGRLDLMPLDLKSPVASAQLKSAVLLAGLGINGTTVVRESLPTRDHTERMLMAMGADLRVDQLERGGQVIGLTGARELHGLRITVPADISSAAFFIVAALLIPGSVLTLPNVGINPTRTGILDTLKEMGADIVLTNRRDVGREPVADIKVCSSPLRGVTTGLDRAPRMIDEFPIAVVSAVFATGVTRFEGVGELRVKESDRLQSMHDALTALGVEVDSGPDWIEIAGLGSGAILDGGVTLDSRHDHRLAMAFSVLGFRARDGVTVTGTDTVATSFPHFSDTMRGVGGGLEDVT